jgi:hypothetical protein
MEEPLMNKYILGDMVTEKLKREIGIVAKPFPEELKTLETVLPSGKICFEGALFQADKLKKITVSKHTHGEGGGTVVMIVCNDDYDLPFILVDIAFDFGKKDTIFTEFEAMPLVRDDESTRKYVEPFRNWREAIDKLPGEPVSGFGDVGEFLKANVSPTEYIRFVPKDHADEVLKFADEFFNIFLDIYGKAEPVKDAQRRNIMDNFRSEWNKHALNDDPSGVMVMEAFGRRRAELFYDHFVNL